MDRIKVENWLGTTCPVVCRVIPAHHQQVVDSSSMEGIKLTFNLAAILVLTSEVDDHFDALSCQFHPQVISAIAGSPPGLSVMVKACTRPSWPLPQPHERYPPGLPKAPLPGTSSQVTTKSVSRLHENDCDLPPIAYHPADLIFCLGVLKKTAISCFDCLLVQREDKARELAKTIG